MLTQRALILKKAEYLTGRTLTTKEQKYVLKNIKLGTVRELKVIVAKLKIVNSAETISAIVERHCRNGSFNTLAKEKLASIMEELATRTWASVSYGMRLLNSIQKSSSAQLARHIFNLYLKDIMKIERAGRKNATNIMKEPITTNQSNRPPQVESPYAWYSFENVEKTNDMAMLNEYDPKTQKLKSEMDTRRLHSEPKKPTDTPRGILILPNIGRPTGGDTDGETKK